VIVAVTVVIVAVTVVIVAVTVGIVSGTVGIVTGTVGIRAGADGISGYDAWICGNDDWISGNVDGNLVAQRSRGETTHAAMSLRSRRQHKAWGVSPRNKLWKHPSLRKRATADSQQPY
jgi:hypothetical protein